MKRLKKLELKIIRNIQAIQGGNNTGQTLGDLDVLASLKKKMEVEGN